MPRSSFLAFPKLLVLLAILALCGQGVGLAVASPDMEGFHGQTALASACTTILNADPEVNSSQFLEICSEAQFGAALRAWGIMNFTWGSSGGPNGTFYDWGFVWIATCRNTTWAHAFGECSEQEYWAANSSTGNVTGPFFQENPAVCAGCPAVLVAPSVLSVFLLLAVPVVGVGAGLAFAIRRQRSKPPKPPTA